MISMTIIIIYFSVCSLLLLFTVTYNHRRYKRLKNQVESPTLKYIEGLNLDINSYTIKLKIVYSQLYLDAFYPFKIALLELKIKNNRKVQNTISQLFNLITTLVSILALMLSSMATIANDNTQIFIDFSDTIINASSAIFILATCILLTSLITDFYNTKSTELISQHFIIAEEVEKELSKPVIEG
jgi:hypothetical protein